MSDGYIEIDPAAGPFNHIQNFDGPSCCQKPWPSLRVEHGDPVVRCSQCGREWFSIYVHDDSE